jgi:hypothetical protein
MFDKANHSLDIDNRRSIHQRPISEDVSAGSIRYLAFARMPEQNIERQTEKTNVRT